MERSESGEIEAVKVGGTLPPVLGDGEAGGRRTRLPGPAASVPGVLLACHHTGFTASRAAHRHVCRAAARGLLCAPGGQLPVLAPVSLCLPHPRAPWTSLSVTWGPSHKQTMETPQVPPLPHGSQVLAVVSLCFIGSSKVLPSGLLCRPQLPILERNQTGWQVH